MPFVIILFAVFFSGCTTTLESLVSDNKTKALEQYEEAKEKAHTTLDEWGNEYLSTKEKLDQVMNDIEETQLKIEQKIEEIQEAKAAIDKVLNASDGEGDTGELEELKQELEQMEQELEAAQATQGEG